MTRSSSGITFCFRSIQKYCIKQQETVSHASHIISRCLYCAFTVFSLFYFAQLKSYFLEKCEGFMRIWKWPECSFLPRPGCLTTNQATGNNGPRLWRWLRSKDLSNWTTALLGCYKRNFWKDNSQCSTSQIWTVWESGQMAEDSSLEFAKRLWKIRSAWRKRL